VTGLITSFDVHHQLCWLALGTSKGAHICWDMRFQLPVTTVLHPTGNVSSSVRLLSPVSNLSVMWLDIACAMHIAYTIVTFALPDPKSFLAHRLVYIKASSIADTLLPLLFQYQQCYCQHLWKNIDKASRILFCLKFRYRITDTLRRARPNYARWDFFVLFDSHYKHHF